MNLCLVAEYLARGGSGISVREAEEMGLVCYAEIDLVGRLWEGRGGALRVILRLYCHDVIS